MHISLNSAVKGALMKSAGATTVGQRGRGQAEAGVTAAGREGSRNSDQRVSTMLCWKTKGRRVLAKKEKTEEGF